MSCGRPVLAAASQALPELVGEGVNGALFHPGDPAAAARAMTFLLDHPERMEAFSAASLKRAASHSLESTLNSYEKIYGLMLAKEHYPYRHPARKQLQEAVDQLWQ
jgi:glycosyltransferase involved in cell wall biosynthesis